MPRTQAEIMQFLRRRAAGVRAGPAAQGGPPLRVRDVRQDAGRCTLMRRTSAGDKGGKDPRAVLLQAMDELVRQAQTR